MTFISKTIFITLVLTFPLTNALADVVGYKKRFPDGKIHTYFQYVYYPQDCSYIAMIKDNPKSYIVKNNEDLSTVSRKCFLLKAGKEEKEKKDKILGLGKDLYDKSGAKSFFKGLMGN